MRKLYVTTLVVMVCLSVARPAQASSFDCLNASTKIEKMICGDAGLSKLDSDLSAAYIHVLERNEDKQRAAQSQKRWLKERRNACQDTECLTEVYTARIRALIANEWSGETATPGIHLPAPVCATKQAPQYCTWPQEKLAAHEQHIIDDAIGGIKKIIIPNLKGAIWVPYDGVDPTNPKIEAYCTAKLTALREGRARFFPQPQAKSSQVGFQKLKQRRGEEAKRESCDKGKSVHAVFDAYSNSYTEWLYELQGGYARLFLNPSDGAVRVTAAFDHCNAVVGLEKSTASRTDRTRAGAGFFQEQALGLVEIEGELFGIEGGVMIMDGDASHWKDEIYFPIWDKTYDMGKDAANSTWTARILALYPLNPPWKEYYRQLNFPTGRKALGEENSRAYDKPCMWSIQD